MLLSSFEQFKIKIKNITPIAVWKNSCYKT